MSTENAIATDPIVESPKARAMRLKAEAEKALQEILAEEAKDDEVFCEEISNAVQMVSIPEARMESGFLTFKVEVRNSDDGLVYGVTLSKAIPEPSRKARGLNAEPTIVEGHAVVGAKAPSFFGFKTGDVLKVERSKDTFVPVLVADADSHLLGLRIGNLTGSWRKVGNRLLGRPLDSTLRGTEAILTRTVEVQRGSQTFHVHEIAVTSDTAEFGIGKSWVVR